LEGVRIDQSKAANVVHLLCEGVGIRAAARLARVDQSTVLNILETAGQQCDRLLDAKIQNVNAEQVAVDELWSFVYCKQANAEPFTDHGDQYVFLAIDKASKLILSHLVGKRTNENCYWFIRDIQGRIPHRFQLSSDSWGGYTGKGEQPGAVEKVFGEDGVDYGTERKMYRSTLSIGGYSPPALLGISRRARLGDPDRRFINTSHAERLNLSARIFNRRFTRLTIGYSKTIENHRHALALFVAHYNFCRKHSAHGTTPAQAAQLTDHPWTIEQLLQAAGAASQ
jgi:IS1 family transposase